MDFRCFCLSISRLVFGNKIIIERIITQSELWLAKWQEAVDFMETNHRKPSKFVSEERNMRSWWKHNKKLMNAGDLKPERLEMFRQLLEIGEKYRRVNQYE